MAWVHCIRDGRFRSREFADYHRLAAWLRGMRARGFTCMVSDYPRRVKQS